MSLIRAKRGVDEIFAQKTNDLAAFGNDQRKSALLPRL